MKPHAVVFRSPVRQARLLLGFSAVCAGTVAFALSVIALLHTQTAILESYDFDYDFLLKIMLGHGIAAVGLAFTFLWFGRKRSARPWVPKGLLIVASLGLLLSVDRFLILLDPPLSPRSGFIRSHPQRGWTHIPNATGDLRGPVRIDRHGLRVAETGPIRSIHDKTRILFLGDSVTFGYGLPAQEAFCHQAVRILNQRHTDLNAVALNAGVSGYDLGQEAHFLEHDGMLLDPALVIVQVCLNDVTSQFDRFAKRDRTRHDEFLLTARPRYWSGLHHTSVKIADRIRYGTDRQAAAEEMQHLRFEELLAAQASERVEQAWRGALRHLGSIIETCREADVSVAVVCTPIRMQLKNDESAWDPQRILAEYAEAQDVPFLRLLPVLSSKAARNGEKAGGNLFRDQTHLNALGNRIIAETLADFLDDCGFVAHLRHGSTAAP